MKPSILVLLSTYNGERYLSQQLDSLLQQVNIQLQVLIRDDGSSDSTQTIIRGYLNKHPRQIRFFSGKNSGARESFFELIKSITDDLNQFDYFAFCDQDDVWEPNKLERATKLLSQENSDLPLMYCSSTQMVDSNLIPIGIWPTPPKKGGVLYNAVVENIAVGCTTVLNRRAMQLISSHFPIYIDQIIMHDWWAYLCVSAFGKIIFDEQPFIQYRQHGQNALGGQTDSFILKWKKRWVRFFRGDNQHIIVKQAKHFYECYADEMEANIRKDIEQLLKATKAPLFSRATYIMKIPFFRQSRMDQLILKLVILAGKI